MREFCLTEEILQQFIDGELSPEQTEGVASHVASCDACAQLLSEVEQENALLMEAFAPEMSLAVPTVRLRERLDTAITQLAPQPRAIMSAPAGSRIRGWFESLFGSLSFTPQRALGFASLVAVLAFAAILATIQLRHSKDAMSPVAVNTVGPKAVQSSDEVKATDTVAPVQSSTSVGSAEPSPKPTVGKAVNRVQRVRSQSVSETVSQTNIAQTPKIEAAKPPQLLPGERSYLEAIASLTTAIETNKDDVLKPTVRADYERNLAVVDQAIASTRQQAKRNPNDRDAVEFMYMAYQNKIELLSAVADQTRIASR